MPNHVKNVIVLKGKNIKDFVDSITIEDARDPGRRLVDFNTIIPMPKDVRETAKIRLTVAEMDKMKEQGQDNWYDWSINHWGTKWNSYDNNNKLIGDDGAILIFETAWNSPIEVVMKLCEMCKQKNIELYGMFASEDSDYCGVIDGYGPDHDARYVFIEDTDDNIPLQGILLDYFTNDYEYRYDDEDEDPELVEYKQFYDSLKYKFYNFVWDYDIGGDDIKDY